MSTLSRSPLQFAVVREDPRVEATLIAELQCASVLLVASGGCTALALRARCPDVDITLIEPNAAQVAHVARKLEALADLRPARFNVGDDARDGLSECGNFEGLFRTWRAVLDEFVVTKVDRARRLRDPNATWTDVCDHPYWPVAFALAFADPMLRTMFGPDAVQHAAPGSYPEYFRARIETGLASVDRTVNPWLHHLLLGCYSVEPEGWPPFLQQPPRDLRPFPVLGTTLMAAPPLVGFDLVQLSNVLDWMADADCRRLAARLAAELRPGAAVLWRQLNDHRPLREYFEPAFVFDDARDAHLLASERSLFYDRVHAGVRV